MINLEDKPAPPTPGRTTGLLSRLLGDSSLKSGLPPGTPVHVGERKTEKPRITVVDYDPAECRVSEADLPEACALYRDRPNMTWINIDGLHQVELIERFARCFRLHPLTIEDICNTHQRPKLDIYDDYLYLVVKSQHYLPESRSIEQEQVSLVIGANFLLTFQEGPSPLFDGVRRRLSGGKGRIRHRGADYLAYALLDAVVDNYFQMLETLGEEIEEIEEAVLAAPDQGTIQRLHLLRRELILLRKSIWPLRELLSGLLRQDGEVSLIAPDTAIYLRDLYDHTIQVIDTVETYRDLLAGLIDIHLSSLSNRMNEIIKVLTMFAVIFIPLTFIAGVYGMNFAPEASPWNMPELNWYWGYPLVLLLMAAVTGSMLIYFRYKKWL